MSDPSSALRETLKAIRDFIHAHGIPPTYQEIADLRGIKAPSVFEQVRQLVDLGYLRQLSRRSRNLEIVDPPPAPAEEVEWVPVPLVGKVPAGSPVMCDENVIGEIMVERQVVRKTPCFALEVKGDSMKDAQIESGDYVVVRQQPIAENGEIVVALVNGEATLKRLRLFPDRWELRPENPDFHPIVLSPDDELRIVGKVIAVRRGRSEHLKSELFPP